MAGGVLEFDGELLKEARRQYEQGDTPLSAIADSLGCSRTTLVKRIAEWGWGPRPAAMRSGLVAAKPSARRVDSTKPSRAAEKSAADVPPAAGDRAALIGRMQRSIERELGAIEAIVSRLGTGGANATQAERAARTLASLVRTLHELTRLDAGASGGAVESQDDDAVPRDLDELRRELARRIDLLRQRRIADGPAGADDA